LWFNPNKECSLSTIHLTAGFPYSRSTYADAGALI
jgi:hypothetical protein